MSDILNLETAIESESKKSKERIKVGDIFGDLQVVKEFEERRPKSGHIQYEIVCTHPHNCGYTRKLYSSEVRGLGKNGKCSYRICEICDEGFLAVGDHQVCCNTEKCNNSDLGHLRRNSFTSADLRDLEKRELSKEKDFELWKEVYRIQGGICAISKLPFDNTNPLKTISPDRIDSNLGYVEGNLQLVRRHHNWGRNIYSVDNYTKCLEEEFNIKYEEKRNKENLNFPNYSIEIVENIVITEPTVKARILNMFKIIIEKFSFNFKPRYTLIGF